MLFICVAGSLSTLTVLCAGLVPTWTRNTVNTAIQTLSVFIVVDSACDLFIALTAHYSSRNLPYPVHNTEWRYSSWKSKSSNARLPTAGRIPKKNATRRASAGTFACPVIMVHDVALVETVGGGIRSTRVRCC